MWCNNDYEAVSNNGFIDFYFCIYVLTLVCNIGALQMSYDDDDDDDDDNISHWIFIMYVLSFLLSVKGQLRAFTKWNLLRIYLTQPR